MILNRLLCPCFDLLWVVLPKPGSSEKRPLAFICGGGGSAKSGVKNQIQIMEYVGENGFEMLQSWETGDNLCCSLSTVTSKDDVVICAAVNGSCMIYTCAVDKKDKIAFTERVQFLADSIDTNSGCVNCTATFLDEKKNLCVLTAGDEGICRLWHISKADAGNDTWKAVLVKEFKAHKGPVMSVSVHPSKPWFCSGSRDGTFKVWDMAATEGEQVIADVPLSSGTPENDSSKKLECRGCEFSADGSSAYLIQSARSGGAHLVKWNIIAEAVEGKSQFSLQPVSAVACSKVPATKLKINAAEGVIGVGSSDGVVAIFRLADMSKVSSYEAHDMPVTGLSFCPMRLPIGAAASSQKSLVLSCSVDYRLASMDLNARSKAWKYLCYFFFVLLVLAFAGLVLHIYNDPTPKVILA